MPTDRLSTNIWRIDIECALDCSHRIFQAQLSKYFLRGRDILLHLFNQKLRRGEFLFCSESFYEKQFHGRTVDIRCEIQNEGFYRWRPSTESRICTNTGNTEPLPFLKLK